MAIRSPGYPSISLEDALEKARLLYKHDKRNATSINVVAGHWNYRPTSSGAKLAVAALKKFGLLESVGNKKSGQVKLTDLALQIILDQREDSPERDQAIKRAALNPDLHAELWDKYGHDLPSDATIKTYLVMHRGFNDATVGDFLKEYKATISFSKLGPGDTISEDDSAASGHEAAEMGEGETAPHGVGVTGNRGTVAGLRGNTLTLPVPLIGGGMASLSVPIPLSEENFNYLTGMIESMLNGMKKALVEPRQSAKDRATEHKIQDYEESQDDE
jgi:hypothetical protein